MSRNSPAPRLVALAGVVVVVVGCAAPSPSPTTPATLPTASPSAPVELEGTWRSIPSAPISARVGAAAAWTGSELLVWGGHTFPAEKPDEPQGAAYDPAADRWRLLPDAPIEAREAPVATYTGSELLVWGGQNGAHPALADGAAYDPGSDTWRRIAPSPLRGGVGFVGAWTGAEWLLVEANRPAEPRSPSGAAAAYDPATDTWREIAPAPLQPGYAAVASWIDGSLVILRFSKDGTGGARYDPGSDSWTAIAANPGLGLQAYVFATATDDGLLVTRDTVQDASGIQAGPAAWLYDPVQSSWRPVADPPPQLPDGPPVLGHGLVISYAPGGEQSWAYSTAEDRWMPVPVVDDRRRESWTAVWTGQDLLIWGGSNPGGPTTTDGRALRIPG